MLVSCICVCHNKPEITHEAIQSILDQRYPHWEALVVDSGVLYDAGYYDPLPWRNDPRVKLIRSEETDETRRTKAMAPWCYNQCFRKGLVSGDLVMYLCDDDILYPHAFATFVAYCRQNPDAQAMYAGQDVAVIYPNGWRAIVGERRARGPGGRSCNGRRMDCHVDYLQLCHKASILGLFPDHEYWPEDKESETHADGIFMERIGERTPIYPIDVKVSQNRRTIHSTYAPLRSFALVECMANGIPMLPPHSGETAKTGTDDKSVVGAEEDVPLVTISVAFRNPRDCLPDTLASLAEQTYARLEVFVIDHCSADNEPVKVFDEMRAKYPGFRFLRRGEATADRGLWEAQGDYFITMDADTVACPEMVERLVGGMRRNSTLSAMTCYLMAFMQSPYLTRKPDAAGWPQQEQSDLLASTKNIYSGGIFRSATLRAVGGLGMDGERTGQEWIGFLKLVNHGYAVGIIPEHLFSYRSPADESVRTEDRSQNRERALRPFLQMDLGLADERAALWAAFAVMQQRLEELTEQNQALRKQNEALEIRCGALRYAVADRLAMLSARVPFAKRSITWLMRSNHH